MVRSIDETMSQTYRDKAEALFVLADENAQDEQLFRKYLDLANLNAAMADSPVNVGHRLLKS